MREGRRLLPAPLQTNSNTSNVCHKSLILVEIAISVIIVIIRVTRIKPLTMQPTTPTVNISVLLSWNSFGRFEWGRGGGGGWRIIPAITRLPSRVTVYGKAVRFWVEGESKMASEP